MYHVTRRWQPFKLQAAPALPHGPGSQRMLAVDGSRRLGIAKRGRKAATCRTLKRRISRGPVTPAR